MVLSRARATKLADMQPATLGMAVSRKRILDVKRRPRMSDVWYARQLAKQAVAAGCHASTIRKHMTGRPGAVTRRG